MEHPRMSWGLQYLSESQRYTFFSRDTGSEDKWSPPYLDKFLWTVCDHYEGFCPVHASCECGSWGGEGNLGLVYSDVWS